MHIHTYFYLSTLPRMMKRKRMPKMVLSAPSIVDSLPNDTIIEVLARVAAFSFFDYINAKLSCKVFNALAEDGCVYRQVSLESCPIVSWRRRKETSSFLDRCKENGNTEALFRQGLVDYFSHTKMESSLELLKRAAESGHLAATYAFAVILLSSGEEHKQQAVKHLAMVRTRELRRVCRAKLKGILCTIWLNNRTPLQRELNYCCEIREQHKRKQGWSTDSDDENYVDCEACQCDGEVIYLRKQLGNPCC